MIRSQPFAMKSPGEPVTQDLRALLDGAVQHHQAGRLGEAEKMYRAILARDPAHADALHLLGVLAHQTGHHESALELIDRALAVKGKVAMYHNSRGNVLVALGKSGEAEKVYDRAANLDPDYAEAHLNIGNILKNQGNLRKAAARYERALSINPDYAVAHMNLGALFLTQHKTDEAISRFQRALALNPDYAEAHNNLGAALLAQGKVSEARESFAQALALKPDYAEAREHFYLTHFMASPVSEWGDLCRRLLAEPALPEKLVHDLTVRLGIHLWVVGSLTTLPDVLTSSGTMTTVKTMTDKNVMNMRTYEDFLKKLLNFHTSISLPPVDPLAKPLALIGDSHCLSYANTVLNIDGAPHNVVPHLIIGCKAWHLAEKDMNSYKASLQAEMKRLTPGSRCLVTFGEIDCRYNEGILGYYKKHGGDLAAIVEAFVPDYVANVCATARAHEQDLAFLNVPAPNLERLQQSHNDFTEEDRNLLPRVIQLFNDELKQAVERQGRRIVDVYRLTAEANGSHHLDEHHLNPNALSLVMAAEKP